MTGEELRPSISTNHVGKSGVVGGKPTLVMVPGTLCTERTFEYQQRQLSYRVDVDVRRLAGAHTTEGYARDLLDDAPDRFALCGFSQGAIVALDVMRRAPERVVALALIACNPNPPRKDQLETWAAWKQEAKERGIDRIAALLTKNVAATSADDQELVGIIVDMARNTVIEDFIGQLDALSTRDNAWPVVERVRCPTVVIVGASDPVTPLLLHRELHTRLQVSELHAVPDCGHYAPLEQPEAVTRALRSWLKDAFSTEESKHA